MCPIMDEMLAIVGAHSLWLDPYFFAHQNSYANSGRISKMYHGKFSGAFGIPEVRTTAAVLTANPKANQTPHLFYEPLRWNVTIFRGDLHFVRIARKIFSRSQEVYDCTTRNYTLKNWFYVTYIQPLLALTGSVVSGEGIQTRIESYLVFYLCFLINSNQLWCGVW